MSDNQQYEDRVRRNREQVFQSLDPSYVPSYAKKTEKPTSKNRYVTVGNDEVPIDAYNDVVDYQPSYYEESKLKSICTWSVLPIILWELFLYAAYMLILTAGSIGMMMANGMSYESAVISLEDNDFISILLNAICALVASLLTVLICSRKMKFSPFASFKKAKMSGWQLLRYIVIGFGLQIVASYLISIIEYVVLQGDESTTADFSTNGDFPTVLVTIIYTCIIAPIFEELLFRGFVLKNASRISLRFGIMLSAFLFGLFHMNLSQCISAGIFGILLGYVAVKTDSILPCIILHCANNCYVMLMQFVYENASDQFITRLDWILLLVIIIGSIFSLIIAFSSEHFPKDGHFLKLRTWKLLFRTPACVLIIVVMSVLTLYISFAT